MRLLALILSAFLAPVVSWACGGKTSSQDSKRGVEYTFRKPSPGYKVLDDDGMFTLHYLVSHCAGRQGSSPEKLDCWPDVSLSFISALERLEDYYSRDLPAHLKDMDIPGAEKKRRGIAARKSAETWSVWKRAAESGMTVAKLQGLMEDKEFIAGRNNSYATKLGKLDKSRNMFIKDLEGRLGFGSRVIPDNEVVCGMPRGNDIEGFRHVSWSMVSKVGDDQTTDR